VRGLQLHPPLQQFDPNDRLAYPLYEVFDEARLPVLFHTGHSGIGTGMPGGGGIRLKYGNPMPIDDVAVDFPEMPIILAHPSFPWQDEAISICLHKPTVYIDLSGWSPKYFSPTLIQYANTLLKHKVLFGSDYPLITPDRWLADFEKTTIREEVRPLILKENAVRLLGLGGARVVQPLPSTDSDGRRACGSRSRSVQPPLGRDQRNRPAEPARRSPATHHAEPDRVVRARSGDTRRGIRLRPGADP